MIMNYDYDVIVIGSGPAGLAASMSAKKHGAERVLLIERDNNTGGILNQCIHDGFGIFRYKKQLTGPEYAELAKREALKTDIEIKTGYLVTDIQKGHIVTAVSKSGIFNFKTKTIILATGCRERTRGMISTPGTRPAGIYTAGTAQNFINNKNIMVGRKVVILGSGDIGLIMARRLSLEGAKVLADIEIMPDSSGLSRNIRQCLFDFDIPIYLSHTVSRIFGKDRICAVEISEINENKHIIPNSSRKIECDTLILSVGLIPENELAKNIGIKLDLKTNGVITDEYLQTNIEGIFSCGNSRSVMDLADFVSLQGELAGENAVKYINGESMVKWDNKNCSVMHKGVPDPNDIICTLCPNGCLIKVNNNEYSGNKCPRGKVYAKQELSSPERILTTTVRLNNSSVPLIPVRSDRPVKKLELFTLIDKLHNCVLQPPVSYNQILFKNFGQNKVNIISQAEILS